MKKNIIKLRFSMKIQLTGNLVAIVQWIVCWFIKRKTKGLNHRSNIKMKYEKIFLQHLVLSRFVAKTLRAKKKSH